MITRCVGGRRSRRAAINARNEPGSAVLVGLALASSASSVRNSGFPPLRSYELVGQRLDHGPTDDRLDEPHRLMTFERIERHAHGDRMIDRRRPLEISVVALCGDQQHRPVGERSSDALEQFDDEHVGPLQIVEPQHDRAERRPASQTFDDVSEQRLAGLRGRDVVQIGRGAEEMQRGFHEPIQRRIVRLEPVQLDPTFARMASRRRSGGIGTLRSMRR